MIDIRYFHINTKILKEDKANFGYKFRMILQLRATIISIPIEPRDGCQDALHSNFREDITVITFVFTKGCKGTLKKWDAICRGKCWANQDCQFRTYMAYLMQLSAENI